MPRNGQASGRRGRVGGTFGNITITDAVRIGVDLSLKNFRIQEEETELEFPTSLGKLERAYIHKLAPEMGFKSKSRGNGQNRYITVYKNEGSTIVSRDAMLSLSKESIDLMTSLLAKYPVNGRERADLRPITERTTNHRLVTSTRSVGRLASGQPKIPASWGGKTLLSRRKELPIWEFRENIINTINSNQVVLVTGDTGSGKTTQVPQFILEESFSHNKPVRVIVCEPRRLAVTTVSERVAQERDERLGDSVGYQIRLDSCTSAKNLLTFCTYGVLLRSLMGGGDDLVQNVTHIVVDEVHERDRLSDFLLTVLRDMLERSPNLKLILMSATVDSQQFLNYFQGCIRVSVPGRMFPVEEFFLEDVLSLVKYNKKGGTVPKKVNSASKKKPENVVKPMGGHVAVEDDDVIVEDDEKPENDPVLDTLLGSAFMTGSVDILTELVAVLETDITKLNYQHSEKGVTILMVAAARGATQLIEFALGLGANPHLRAPNGWTALDFATNTGQTDAVKVLETFLARQDDFYDKDDASAKQMTDEDRQLLESYQNSFDDDTVDHELILNLLRCIHDKPQGAVLVFLPGYEDIMTVKELIQKDVSLKTVNVLTLHSQMASSDHKRAFQPSKGGQRKVILSTNIAETGITLNDVIYVIDSGKAKEMSFDSLTNSSMLKSHWISQSSATQRKGRAGRCQAGECYRLFSSIRFAHMPPYQTPEILRTPLAELCLQSKLLAPPNTPIADFLAKVPEPPAFLVTKNAVQSLKTLEALDQWEEVTPLGSHLLDIPLDPVFGKILLHGVVLQCLDPVLTIVCSLSYRDPFLIPSDSRGKRSADLNRKRLAGSTFSDHNALLNAFKEWDLAKQTGRAWSWCTKNGVSNSTMEMIQGMKNQVLSALKQSGLVKAKAGGYNSGTNFDTFNNNSDNWSLVKACIIAGLYPNIARYDREAGQLRTSRESKVKIHPGSVCADLNKQIKSGRLPSEWCVFTEMTRVGRTAYIRGVTFISPGSIALICGPSRLAPAVWEIGERTCQVNHFIEATSDSEEEEHSPKDSVMINLDSWLTLRSSTVNAKQLLQFRAKWAHLWIRYLSSPGKQTPEEMDLDVITGMGDLLRSEDLNHNLIAQHDSRSLLLEGVSKLRLQDNPKQVSGSTDENLRGGPATTRSQLARGRGQEARGGGQGSRGGGPMAGGGQRGPGGNRPTHTKYFVVRPSPGSLSALEAAMSHGPAAVWTFAPPVDRKLATEIQAGHSVIVLFNVLGTNIIQGCCRLLGQIVREGNRTGQRIEWVGRHGIDYSLVAGGVLPNADLQLGKEVSEVSGEIAQSVLARMSVLENALGRGGGDWGRRGKYFRRN